MKNRLLFSRLGLMGMLTLFFVHIGHSQLRTSVDAVKCYGGADGRISILADQVLTYEWLDGVTSVGTSSIRTGLSVGTYTVVMRLGRIGEGGENCFDVRSFEVTGPKKPLEMQIRALPEPGPHKCWRKVPVTLEISATGGTPPYQINGHQTDKYRQTISSTGVYQFYITDHNKVCNVRKKRKVLIEAKWCSTDPNEIQGPSGYDTLNWVSKYDTLSYTIRFENDPFLANAPAQYVLITHAFDEKINPYSFRLGSFGFGNHTFSVPANVPSFQKRYDLTEELDIYLDVVAGLDVQTNRAFWSFTAIDPLTGQRPNNPLIGFLPVNDTLTSSGEGFVSFFVKPKSNTITGDIVHAQAQIVFDANEPIITNVWTNVIDALPPVTILETVEPVTENNIIDLSWTGSDDQDGSGLGEIELYVSIDSSSYELVDVISPDSSTYTYTGTFGRQHAFKTIGVDHTGNREVKLGPGNSVFVLPRKQISFEDDLDLVYCTEDSLVISWESTLVDSIDLLFKINTTEPKISLAQRIGADEFPFVWVIPDSLSGMYLQLHIMMSDSSVIQDSSVVFFVNGLPEVEAGNDIQTCIGAIHHLLPSGAKSYLWQPQTIYSPPGSTIQSFIADSNIVYYVIGTDAFGCINSDSIHITVHPTSLDTIVYLLCNQDSIFAGGAYQNQPGFYTDELASSFGCDSTVVTQVILTGPCDFPSPQMYVDEDATGLNNGTSWANAFVELRDGLVASREWANVNEIWIAEGTYSPHPTNRDSSFILRDSIKIFGGFLGFETTRAERTPDPELVYLSGDINIQDTLWDNSYHTVSFNASCTDCILDGLTIRYGYADQIGNNTGAGLLNVGKGHLYNVVFERNYATELGAAVYSSGLLANLTFQSCTFRLNASSLGRDVVNLNGGKLTFDGVNSLH